MKKLIPLAALLLASPAVAVTVTDIWVTGDNSATIVTAEPGKLEVDVAFSEFSPIRLGLAADEGETGFAFNSVVDSFTGVTLGENMTSLRLTLTGARFDVVGDILPAFSTPLWTLSDDGTRLDIRFRPAGEGVGVLLGNVLDDGSTDFAILYTDGPVSLGFASSVPEPATWAMMIAGFGLIGAVARRRAARLA
jgi:hypothetical protein